MTGAMIRPFRGTVPTVANDAWLAETAVLVGDVQVGAGSSIWYGCVLRGDVAEIRIGKRSNIQDGTVIHVSSKGLGTHVGDGVTVGHMAVLHACRLHNDSFVGMKACVMDGAEIEPYAMVAAGAVITPGKRVRTGELWAGTPGRVMRDITEEEHWLITSSATRYMDLAAIYRAEPVT